MVVVSVVVGVVLVVPVVVVPGAVVVGGVVVVVSVPVVVPGGTVAVAAGEVEVWLCAPGGAGGARSLLD